jgi:hypothetical protein
MRGNANLRYNIFLIIPLLLVGCSPMAEISIQVMEPAKITLPSYVNQVAFLNHSYVPKIQPDDTSGYSQKEIYILDTVINNQIFSGLQDGLNESPLFDLDSIHIIQFRRRDTNNFLEPLTTDQIHAVNQSEKAEAVISLEYYRIQDTISMDTYQMDYMGNRRMISHTVWRIYNLSNDSIFDEYMLKDTVDWYVFGYDSYTIMESLPEFINSLRTASYNAGLKYGQRISPSWFDVPRFYYTSGGEAMREAKKLAASRDWKGAAEIWKKQAYQENEKVAAKACFNMALVCEIEDLLIPALDWAIKSYFIKQEPVTKEYIDQLKVRYEKQKVIKTQLPARE